MQKNQLFEITRLSKGWTIKEYGVMQDYIDEDLSGNYIIVGLENCPFKNSFYALEGNEYDYIFTEVKDSGIVTGDIIGVDHKTLQTNVEISVNLGILEQSELITGTTLFIAKSFQVVAKYDIDPATINSLDIELEEGLFA